MVSEKVREFPRGMPLSAARAAVTEVAIAYVDHLCSFNALAHPAVQRERLRLSEAVDAFHHSNPDQRLSLFSWEDVDLLEGTACGYESGDWGYGLEDLAARHRDLAQRLADLLPPREPVEER